MHAEVRGWVASRLPAGAHHVVEFGSRNINGGVRDLLETISYVGLDLEPGDGVDLVVDAARWAPGRLYDLALCLEVLEHALEPVELVEAAARALRPGGMLLLTCATDPREPHSAVDGGVLRPGERYENVDPLELVRWLGDAQLRETELVVEASRGDLYCAAIREE